MDNETTQKSNYLDRQPRHLSVLAVLSMILSLFFFIPIVSGLFGIILGAIALYSIAIHKDELRGRGLAVTGIILGLGQLLLAIVFLSIIVFTLVFGAVDKHSRSPLHGESYPRKDYGAMVGVNEFNSCNEKGISFRAEGKPKEALQAYQAALNASRKEMGIAYYGIGSICMDLGQYDKAISDFDKAIECNPNLYDAYQNKAVTYRLMGRYQDSIDACKETIARFPDFARAYCSMGWAYEYLGKYKEAIEAHLEAIRMEPGWQFPRLRIEDCLSALKDERIRLEVEEKIKQIELKKDTSSFKP